jgi:hypothetical protein
MELQDTIREKVRAAYDELNEKVDEAYNKFEKFTNLLGQYKEILELSAIALGPVSKTLIDSVNATMIENAKN